MRCYWLRVLQYGIDCLLGFVDFWLLCTCWLLGVVLLAACWLIDCIVVVVLAVRCGCGWLCCVGLFVVLVILFVCCVIVWFRGLIVGMFGIGGLVFGGLLV